MFMRDFCVESNRRGCTGCDRMYGGSAPSVNSSGTCSRAMHYFIWLIFYADQYDEATKDKLSVPLITSASVEAPSPQVTLQTIL